MIIKHRFITAKAGSGIKPSVIVKGVVSINNNWGAMPQTILVEHVEVLQTEGSIQRLADRIDKLTPEFDQNRMVDAWGKLDVALDVTSAPALEDLISDADGFYEVTTGTAHSDYSRHYKVGRLRLFDEARRQLDDNRLVFSQDRDGWPDVQTAMSEATGKPPRNEQDGLLLLETTTNDDITLAISLLVWRAIKHTPITHKEIDYSAMDAANTPTW